MSNLSHPPICYCCSQKSYAECCEPFHLGQRLNQLEKCAPTAEALMRSRYSAFCTGNADYLFATLHPSFRQLDELQQLQKTMGRTQWLGLRIINSRAGQVEFVAFFKTEKVEQLHENSNFIFEDGAWFYTHGIQLPALKLNRNDACYCGSLRKLKKCCG
ncbi:MAG: YchJ family protein [Marinagarivorans sp.]|nr:YchJ family protein [Marinagarivorans sp.]